MQARLARTETSAVSEHAGTRPAISLTGKTSKSRQGFSLIFTKRGYPNQTTPKQHQFCRDRGIETPHAWMNTIRKHRERTKMDMTSASRSLPHRLTKTCRLQLKHRGLFNDKNRETVGEICFIVYKNSMIT